MLHRTVLAFVATVPLMVGTPRAHAQGPAEQTAVTRAALDYLEGFYEGDTAKLTRSIWKDVHKFGYWQNKPGEAYAPEAMPWAEIIKYGLDTKAGKHKTPPNAPKDVTVFEVQDQTASAKVTAWWGTDYLLMAKQNGRWMITHILWQGPLKK